MYMFQGIKYSNNALRNPSPKTLRLASRDPYGIYNRNMFSSEIGAHVMVFDLFRAFDQILSSYKSDIFFLKKGQFFLYTMYQVP